MIDSFSHGKGMELFFKDLLLPLNTEYYHY